MKPILNITKRLPVFVYLLISLFLISTTSSAQEGSEAAAPETPARPKLKPVKNTFESVWIIDNQTVMVPNKGTFEMDIMHRFGVINKGYDDFYGLFAPSNIRLGFSYAPINKLSVGLGLTKSNMLWDASAKYSLMSQIKSVYPVSITYYGNMAYDTRKDEDQSLFKHSSDRFSFFNQLIIARKVTSKLSLQIAPSISHQNAVNGFYTKNDSTGTEIFKEMENNHFAVALSGRYKLTNVTSFMLNYDQPLTKHATHNPDPSLSFGFEFNTSNHSFQLFFTNYFYLSPQRNNLYNTNSPFSSNDETKTHPDRLADDPSTPQDESIGVRGGRFLIGFNITRLWNF